MSTIRTSPEKIPGNLSIRVNARNPNHHLFDNNGTWFTHYTVHRSDYTKRRIRRSLKTRDLRIARKRRDEHLRALLAGCRS